MGVIVVGAGLAGLACARELDRAGVAVHVFDREPVVGGRLGSAVSAGRSADVGAGYFTANDPAFVEQVRTWLAAGVARPWTDTLMTYDRGGPPHASTGPVRFTAPGGLRALAEDLAAGLDVTLGCEVTELPRADAVVLAMPGPQALRLLTPDAAAPAGGTGDTGTGTDGVGLVVEAARLQRWSAVLAVVLTYPERSWPCFRGAFVNNHPVLDRVFDDGDRRGDHAPVLVAHTNAEFAAVHLDRPADAGPEVERATRELLGLPTPATAVHVHPWRYAQPGARPDSAEFVLGDGVALAGDAFGRPRVQTAWLSGRAAGAALAARLG
ncbi:NAD(P)/FAD-dependent oxidoreductase [Krasilnikovia sp. M28-CT-15]|uniref:NAD(P)/FAD-dependent oxidoreductase n=1 Tax=Krasilnikovia sp. M28-CT-15 TaxID=3373540 RepID=UPI003876DA32